MLAHDRSLEEQVGERGAAISAAASDTGSYQPAVAVLITYFTEEILPHAPAEERSIYTAAGALPALAVTVAELLAAMHQLTAGHGRQLDGPTMSSGRTSSS